MTPNPNPSPELRTRLKYYPDYIDDPDGLERFRQAVLSNSGHDMAAVNHNSLGRLIDTIERLRRERDAALSPQTLPAPGEVEDVRKRAQSIWDKRWFCIEGEWSPDEEPIETDEPRRFAEIAIAALPPTLATVAAANDEGVAMQAARDEVIHRARSMPRKTPAAGGCATVHQFPLEAGEVWMLDKALTELDHLLSQGGGK